MNMEEYITASFKTSNLEDIMLSKTNSQIYFEFGF